MKDTLIEVHFDELLLVGVLILAGVLYWFRPETKDILLGPLAGALMMALRGKMGNGKNDNKAYPSPTQPSVLSPTPSSDASTATKAILPILFILFLCGGMAHAQTVTPAPVPTNNGPQFTVGLGWAYDRYADPGTPTTNMLAEFSARLKGAVHSYSSIDLYSQYAMLRTGLAYYAYSENYISLFLLAQAGLTISGTSAANSSGLAIGNFSGGAGVAYDFGGMFKKLQGKQLGISLITRLNSTSTTTTTTTGRVQPSFEILMLKGFGK
jgi:hypothetical protein